VLNLLDMRSEVLLSLVFVSLDIQTAFVHTVYNLEWHLHFMFLLNGRH